MNVDRDRNMALKPSYNDKLYLPGLSLSSTYKCNFLGADNKQ